MAAAGNVTVVVMKAGYPADAPVQAIRPPIGLPKLELIVASYPPATNAPPAVMMSANAPPLMEISRTIPSNVLSSVYLLRKLSVAPPAGTAILGEFNHSSETTPGLFVNAELGAL